MLLWGPNYHNNYEFSPTEDHVCEPQLSMQSRGEVSEACRQLQTLSLCLKYSGTTLENTTVWKQNSKLESWKEEGNGKQKKKGVKRGEKSEQQRGAMLCLCHILLYSQHDLRSHWSISEAEHFWALPARFDLCGFVRKCWAHPRIARSHLYIKPHN